LIRRTLLLLVAAGVLALFVGAPAFAEGKFLEPSQNPYQLTFDAKGQPVAFTVKASGFVPESNAYVEVCNGRVPSDPDWSPTRDCDNGTSPAAAIVDAQGNATFAATDANRKLVLFVGESPQQLFNCVRNMSDAPKNGLPSFTTCHVRVSTTNAAATKDQVLLPLVYGGAKSSSSGSSSGVVIAVIVGIVVVAAIALIVVLLRRRAVRAS